MSPIWAQSLCFLPESFTHQSERLSQPFLPACHLLPDLQVEHDGRAGKDMVAGMGPRGQNSCVSDIWENKLFNENIIKIINRLRICAYLGTGKGQRLAVPDEGDPAFS